MTADNKYKPMLRLVNKTRAGTILSLPFVEEKNNEQTVKMFGMNNYDHSNQCHKMDLDQLSHKAVFSHHYTLFWFLVLSIFNNPVN